MAAFEVIALDSATPQLRAPGASDTYTFPRAAAFSAAITYGGVTLSNSVTGTGAMVLATSPTFTTPTLGVATATSINKLTITAPATSATFTLADGKTFAVNHSLTLAGTDSTTMTFPSTSASIARTDAGQTFTGIQTVQAAATQDAVALAGRAGGTNSYVATISPTTLSGNRSVTLPDANTVLPVASYVLTFSGPSAARTVTLPDSNFTAARTDAAQTFSGTQTFGGSVVPATNTVDSVGYTGMPANSQSAAYTTAAADAGKVILHPATDNNARTFTIDSNANVPYPIGTVITFVNMINTVTIAITSDTMYLAGPGTTGSRTLAAYGVATAIKVSSTTWIVSGNGLT